MKPREVLANIKAVLREHEASFCGNRISVKEEGTCVSVYHVRGIDSKTIGRVCALVSERVGGLQVSPVIRTIHRPGIGYRETTSLKVKII